MSFALLDVCAYLGLGALAGFLGGLLGIGGGFVLVPGLYSMFCRIPAFAGHELPMALGTTMACIIFTAASSVRANAKRDCVRFDVVRRFAVFVSLGCVSGAYLATVLDTSYVKLGFASFCLYSATRMLFVTRTHVRTDLHIESTNLSVPGVCFGTICGLIGVGGANLFVPFFLKRQLDLRHAMATASALQIPIAIAGSVGYIVLGLHVSSGAGTLGFVYLPALLLVVVASVLFAPAGVACSHSLPIPTLKRMFGGVTAVIGLKMAGLFTLVPIWLQHWSR